MRSLLVAFFLVPAVASAQDYAAMMAQMHAHDVPIATGAVKPPREEVVTSDVVYATIGGKDIHGFMAMPKGAAKTIPGIVMVHEWWGLNDNIRDMAKRLAGEGYRVLAVDLYGHPAATTPDTAKTLMVLALADTATMYANLKSAVEYLHAQGASKIGTIGWCFGGGGSLEAALHAPDLVNAIVMYYGRPVLDTARLHTLHAPLLGNFGALDQGIPPTLVASFQDALRAAGVTSDVKIYDGANHAFANPSGTAYNEDAAEDAWKRTLAFFAKNLH